jgi:hypothetical protein
MLKELNEYPTTLKEFIGYIKSKNIDVNIFYKLDFVYRIGFYILYLETKNITILFDNYNYCIYYSYDSPITSMHARLKQTLIISESNNKDEENNIGLIENFKIGLIEAFKYIEQPF